MAKTITKLPKRTNANNGKKAHNDNIYYKIGRIRMNSWASKCLAVCDIVIYETELVHIHHRHHKELQAVGMDAFDFVKFIVSNYNQIYKGRANTYKLVVHRTNTSDMAAIELHKINFNGVEMYKINTATPVKTKQLCKEELLCANDH